MIGATSWSESWYDMLRFGYLESLALARRKEKLPIVLQLGFGTCMILVWCLEPNVLGEV